MPHELATGLADLQRAGFGVAGLGRFPPGEN